MGLKDPVEDNDGNNNTVLTPSTPGYYRVRARNCAVDCNDCGWADSNEAVVVAVDTVVEEDTDDQGPIYVCVTEDVNLLAKPDPCGAEFPDGEPHWSIVSKPTGASPTLSDVSDSNTTTLSGMTKPGVYVVRAKCCNGDGDTITVIAVDVGWIDIRHDSNWYDVTDANIVVLKGTKYLFKASPDPLYATWLPEDPNYLREHVIMIRDEYGLVDALHIRWEKRDHVVEITQTMTVFAAKVTRANPGKVHDTVEAKTKSARGLCAQLLNEFAEIEAVGPANSKVAKVRVMVKLLGASFDHAKVQSFKGGIHGWCRRPDAKDKSDLADSNHWWRRVNWWTDGKSVGFYTVKTEGEHGPRIMGLSLTRHGSKRHKVCFDRKEEPVGATWPSWPSWARGPLFFPCRHKPVTIYPSTNTGADGEHRAGSP
jgi:hypothetical protein